MTSYLFLFTCSARKTTHPGTSVSVLFEIHSVHTLFIFCKSGPWYFQQWCRYATLISKTVALSAYASQLGTSCRNQCHDFVIRSLNWRQGTVFKYYNEWWIEVQGGYLRNKWWAVQTKEFFGFCCCSFDYFFVGVGGWCGVFCLFLLVRKKFPCPVSQSCIGS